MIVVILFKFSIFIFIGKYKIKNKKNEKNEKNRK